ncbi:MAG TPA: hypothetical protein VFB10_07650 [Candidatus Dormibacteraeota bacterium]|nr:hypothetical protein [Candidatus Dormibacteraeota bacterium]
MSGAVQRRDSRTRINDRQEVSRHIRSVTRARIRNKEGNIMKSFATIGTTALFLLLGLAVPASARQEKQEESAKPPKQEQAKPEKQEQAKPEKQAQAKPQQQEKQQQQEVKSEKQQQQKTQQQAKGQQEQQQKQEAKSEKQQQDKSAKQEQQQQAKSDKQQHQQPQTVSSHGAPQRSQQAMARQRSQPELRLSERGSGRIPDDHFRSHFGREHHFHMGNPVMVGGYSRFQYGGYWFGFVEPWPDGWYYTDDFYIDYLDGGYYMYNPYYPGARFAITVVL